jgi:hypothetical protein
VGAVPIGLESACGLTKLGVVNEVE